MAVLAVSADGRRLSVAGPRRAATYDLGTGGVIGSGDPPGPASRGGAGTVALSRDGRWYARASGRRGRIAVHDLETGTAQMLEYQTGRWAPQVTAMAFSPDGTQLVTATGSGSVTVRDRLTGAPTLTVHHGDARIWAVTAVSYSPDGSQLAAGSHQTVALWPIAAQPGAPTFRSPASRAGNGPTAIAFSPDGAMLATAHRGGAVRLWHLPTGERSDGASRWATVSRAAHVTSSALSSITAVTFQP